MLGKVKIPPGVFRNGTAYQNSGRWYDANLVRWFEGTMRPVGGWVRATMDTVTGSARGMLAWRQNDFEARAAIGTNSNLYVLAGGSLYDITPAGFTAGRADSAAGAGYGFGVYGDGDYGVSTPSGDILDASTWSFDAWGEKLVGCCVGDGKLYEWSNSLSSPAVVISGAPVDNVGLIVTPERNLVALGADGIARRVKWSDTEDNTEWTASATTSAGDYDLQTDGGIKCAMRTRGKELILTEVDAHTMEYIGAPFYYSFDKAASACGVISPLAASAYEMGAVWMGKNSFFQYDGAAVRPIACDVSDHIFGDINLVQSAKIHAGHNSKYGEVIWFYPSADSNEVNKYVIWSYREGHWSIGELVRTCWVDSGVFEHPLAVDADGKVFEQENGWTNAGAAITTDRFARSGPAELGNGDRVMYASQTLPDELTSGQIRLKFFTRFTPEGEEREYGPYTVSPYMDTRFAGRQIAVEVEGVADEDWRLGDLRVDAQIGGGR